MDKFMKALDFDSDTLGNVKRDMNFVLQRLIGNMMEKGSTNGSLTLKIDVSFTQEYIPNYDPKVEGEIRKIYNPSFKHKVTSTVQISDKKDGNMEWYFVVWYLAATGARVSELIQIKIEHIEIGYFDLYTKGGKLRRLYIPKKLKKETLEWLNGTQRSSGYLFLNRYGNRITTRGISQQLKNYAEKYGLDKKVVYPHSFRHRYAKNFLEKYNDIALLADLMGHESIETTRIYLRRTASEQQELVDKIVTW